MLPPDRDLERRRPVWEALADLFLDTTLDDADRRFVAERIVASGYSPAEVEDILWHEVFPAVSGNLRNPAGQWAGFDIDWLQRRILATRASALVRLRSAVADGSVRRIVREEWGRILRFLPDAFTDRSTRRSQP
jgi:hypothetical protein